ncbi:CRTAC1 family protein [Pacificoceanicola onchidii]|uniref:CRTAC1 family protein n=1 Tax=Pacificoceanicola onchidii TaxID=2562685 RepID=UPI001455E786|nr:CRTAC1 family protein [Pacificoceanicola onchidii]
MTVPSLRSLSLSFVAAMALPLSLTPAQAAEVVSSDRPVTISAHPFAPRSPGYETVFQGVEAREHGIDKPLEFSMKDMWPPFWEGRSLTTGDIDNDDDLDLVIASTDAGLYIYLNDGSGQFSRMDGDLGPVAGLDIFNAALVDIDNDGWLDIFAATYVDGNFVIRNEGGRFDMASPQSVSNRDDAMLTISLSFADADRDGDLDVALGNWAAGWYRRIPGEESRNRLVFNENGVMDGSAYKELPGLPGETLVTLFSDIDLDGNTDLLFGNDFELPDYVYHGDGQGGFTAVTREEGLIPHTTNTTMAIKTADLYNDGSPEIYYAQIAGRSSRVSDRLRMQPLTQYCESIAHAETKALCARNMEIKTWYKSGNRFDPRYADRCQALDDPLKSECLAMSVKDLAIQKKDPSLCALIADDQKLARDFCEVHFKPFTSPLMEVFDTTLRQIMRTNVLLTWEEDRYVDTAIDAGLEIGGWSWDTKIADFDNDGWQDVFIVNGTWVPNEVSPSNLFYRNMGDGSFEESAIDFGLTDYLMTSAAVRFDMDNDGDLDIITQPVNGPVMLYRNGAQTGNALAVDLNDAHGNRFGIGARIEVILPDGTKMMREIQSGGGFMSFDAPVAHFGLGAAQEITALTVVWADGGRTEIAGPLAAGARYRIVRE